MIGLELWRRDCLGNVDVIFFFFFSRKVVVDGLMVGGEPNVGPMTCVLLQDAT